MKKHPLHRLGEWFSYFEKRLGTYSDFKIKFGSMSGAISVLKDRLTASIDSAALT